MCTADCKCQLRGDRIAVQAAGSDAFKVIEYDGRDHLVVPVIMALGNVVMNGSLLPVDQFVPESWNGVPVTVGHPREGDGFISANSPKILTEWSIGRIFNAAVVGESLRADAYIDVARADKVAPTLVSSLRGGKKMDVSTGFFSERDARKGTVNGREYESVHQHIRPDHLAFLPNEAGACNWEDGCGVRANTVKTLSVAVVLSDKAKQAIHAVKLALIGMSNLDQLLVPELMPANEDAPGGEHTVPVEPTTVVEATEGGPTVAKKVVDAAELVKLGYDAATVTAMVAAANATATPAPAANAAPDAAAIALIVKEAITAALAANTTDEDRAALAHAKAAVKAHTDELIAHVVANTEISEEEAKKLSLNTLEVLAKGVRVAAPSFAGRPTPSANGGAGDDEVAKGMVATDLVAHIQTLAKKEAA